MRRFSILLIAVAGAATAAPAVHAQPDKTVPTYWPQFRGPGGLGVAAEDVKFPLRFGPDKNVLWKTPLPEGHSSPCIWGNHIFLTGFDKAGKKLETLCLDRRKGDILWRQAAPAEKFENVHQISNPAVSTPATDGKRVYVYFGSYGLLCYDFAGKEQWKMPLPAPVTRFGTGASPIVAGDLVLCSCDCPPKPVLLAVEGSTGKPRWKKERLPFGEGYATPLVWTHAGAGEVIVHTSARLQAYRLKDGEETWWVGIQSTACSTPVIGADRLFVATWAFGADPNDRVPLPTFDELLQKYDKDKDGKISQKEFPADLSILRRADAADIPGSDVKLIRFFSFIDENKDGHIDRNEWAKVLEFTKKHVEHGVLAIKAGAKGDAGKTHVLWQEKKGIPEVPSPLYYRQRLYLVRDGGVVSCLETKSGKLLYRERLDSAGAYFSSPVAGDGKVYAASVRGVVTVLAAGDVFRVLARNDLQDAIVATPALFDGKIYLRTKKHLYAFAE